MVPLSSTGTLLAGAKCYTYTTGTTTPAATYSDYGLTTPNTNPVVADANGVFPIMFGSAGTLYRLKFTTSADVLIYQEDNIGPETATTLGCASLTASNTFTGTTQKISSAEPRLILDETDAGSDKRLTDIDVQAGVISLRTRTDADGAGKNILVITKGTTTAIASMVYGDASDLPAHTFNGPMTVVGAAATTPVAVTFSATAMTVTCTLSNVFRTTFTANVTVAPTISAPLDGQTINWYITQDSTGNRTMTWPSSFKWPGGVAGVLSTAANSVDLLTASYRSSTGFWYATLTKAFA